MNKEIVDYYFIIIGFIGVFFGVYFLFSRFVLFRNGDKAKGVVVKKITRRWSDSDTGGGYTTLLVINYSLKGVTTTFAEQNSLVSFFYKVGEKVEIIIDNKYGGRKILNNVISLYSAPILIILLSLVFVFMIV